MIKLRRSLDRMLHLQDLIFWIHILYYMLIKNDSSPRSGTKDIIKNNSCYTEKTTLKLLI